MKKWITYALLLLLVGVAGIVWNMRDGNFFSLNKMAIEQQQAVEASGVRAVVLSLDSADLTAVKGSTNEIKASLTGKISEKDAKHTKLSVIRDGDKVTVKVDVKSGFTIGFNIMELHIRLELPAQQYESFVLDAESGKVAITDLAADNMKLKVGSGSVRLDQVTNQTLSVKMESGGATMTNVKTGTAVVKSGSGRIAVDQLTGEKLTVSSESGGITLKDIEAELAIKAESGGIHTESDDIRYPMNLSTESGGVSIKTARQPSSARISFSPDSGSLRDQWEEGPEHMKGDKYQAVFGAGDIPVRVTTGSGSLTLGQR